MKKRIPSAITTGVALVVIGIFVTSIITIAIIQPAHAFINENGDLSDPKAPMTASQDGNNVYIVWWTNKSGNWEVMFRTSNDGGQTFGDKINLSNSPDTQSQTAEILAVGNSMVFVSWWELNANVHPHTNESVLRVSTDAGQTFGPLLMLGVNGTISTAANGNTTGAAEGEED